MQRLGGLIGGAPAMRRMYALIERFAKTDATVLVTGETGTGKELVAEAIHASSRRKDAPFVVLDCRSLAQVAGQLTGAFEAAKGGTLFLDEIGELPLEDQPRLLRAIETKGDGDVRIVAATSRDLAVEVNRERFRTDLYFRLAVARIHAPPLREHREDIDALVDHFVAASGGGQLPGSFKEHARSHPWPGNVRELRSAVEQALVLGDRPELATQQWSSRASLDVDVSVPFKEAKRRILDELEKKYITELIEAHDGNVSAAARAADLDRMTIYKLLRRAGLREPK
jgi:DNA-binding NtrC family response regulator